MQAALTSQTLRFLMALLGTVFGAASAFSGEEGRSKPTSELKSKALPAPGGPPELTPVKKAEAVAAPPPMAASQAAASGSTLSELEASALADPSAEAKPDAKAEEKKKEEPKWYEKIRIRGYSQIRYNRLGLSDYDLRSPNDRSIGPRNNLFIRRARMVFQGDITDNLFIYIQPDFAIGINNETNHILQMRDWYGDVALDEDKEHRIRVGQSKIPYGWENLQSSQNRIALDRDDALNTGAVNERDVGVFYYWAPKEIRERFKHLVDSGLKGSGDYGVFGFGAYNGQSANRIELNNTMHLVSRLTYPFELANGQYFEPGVSGYYGRVQVNRDTGIEGPNDFRDSRFALSFTWYPQPWGLQGEFTWGRGPQFSDDQTFVSTERLHGGYIQTMYKIDTCRCGTLFPYARAQMYRGGRKSDTNAPAQDLREVEIGLEWQFTKALELTSAWAWMDRNTTSSPYPNVDAGLLRFQFQFNY